MADYYYKNYIYTGVVKAPLFPLDNQIAYSEKYSCPNPLPEWKDGIEVTGGFRVEKQADNKAIDVAVPITNEASFDLEDIEDARVIIMVKGKHYSIISTGNKEEAKLYRVALVKALLSMEGQIIVVPSLEEIKINDTVK